MNKLQVKPLKCREVALCIETTGLLPENGDRLLAVGCVELVDGTLTEQRFFRIINPERQIPAAQSVIHGLDDSLVKDAPKFSEIAEDLIRFVGGTGLILHNAPFDLKFINTELTNSRRPLIDDMCSYKKDMLSHAKRLFPGASNSLLSLSKRLGVRLLRQDNEAGVVFDARCLAEVYKKIVNLSDSRQP